MRIYIINDGSQDTTGAVIDRLSMDMPYIKGIHLGSNKGYGIAVRTGLMQCIHDACRYAVCLHADGQYPPEAIAPFIAAMEDTGTDILQGSRIASRRALAGGMPLYKYIAGRILTFCENRVFGLSLSDYHSGFLFYSKKALLTLPFRDLSASFDFDLEAIASGHASGLNIAEKPIPARYADEISYLNPITYGLRVVWIMVKYALGKYRRMR